MFIAFVSQTSINNLFLILIFLNYNNVCGAKLYRVFLIWSLDRTQNNLNQKILIMKDANITITLKFSNPIKYTI